jgi:hypothetical protein
VFLKTDDWPVVTDFKTENVTAFNGHYIGLVAPVKKSIPDLALKHWDFIGANEQQLVFASNNKIQVFDVEAKTEEMSKFHHVVLPSIDSVLAYFNDKK